MLFYLSGGGASDSIVPIAGGTVATSTKLLGTNSLVCNYRGDVYVTDGVKILALLMIQNYSLVYDATPFGVSLSNPYDVAFPDDSNLRVFVAATNNLNGVYVIHNQYAKPSYLPTFNPSTTMTPSSLPTQLPSLTPSLRPSSLKPTTGSPSFLPTTPPGATSAPSTRSPTNPPITTYTVQRMVEGATSAIISQYNGPQGLFWMRIGGTENLFASYSLYGYVIKFANGVRVHQSRIGIGAPVH